MEPVVTDATIKSNTAAFLRSACSVFRDMMNVEFVPEPMVRNRYQFVNGFSAISHFYGSVQGNYIMSTDELTASKIAGVYNPDDSMDITRRNREIFAGMMCEVLNVSAHMSLEGLETVWGRLDLQPPDWVFGEYHTMRYITGVGSINSLYGSIYCSLLINVAGSGVSLEPGMIGGQ